MTAGYFFRSPFFLPWLYPGLTWRIASAEKVIYLTFDDGPVPGPTEFVLDQLSRTKAKATFFCLGDNIRKNGSVFRRIIDKGHAVGNHTFHHLNGWKYATDNYRSDVQLCREEMLKGGMTGQTNLFRPPYGRITRSQIACLTDYHIVMWDVLTNDYARNLSPERCLRGSLDAARPGSIVVFHDSLKAEKNLTYVLPRFLDHFGSQGYRFNALT